jgi:anti-sigma regulatory factor (Ser/Thr protein kinase)
MTMAQKREDLDRRDDTPPLRWVWALPSRGGCLGAGSAAAQHARRVGWTPIQSAELSLVVVELATNALRHGRDGMCTMTLDPVEARLLVYDKGPGYPAWVIERHRASARIEGGGPPTPRNRGLGAGLDVVRRLVTELWLSNDESDGGARAFARILRRAPPHPAATPPYPR